MSHNIDTDRDTLTVYPDQVLTHDGTATSVFLQLEAMGVKRVTPFTVVHVDHNTLQVGHRNPDDHVYLKGMAAKMGAVYSVPGNGICHQVHLENFITPGHILLGSDSHTATAGGLGCLGLGSGGLDIAMVLAGEPYHMIRPQIIGIYLEGRLPVWVTGKDVILHLLGLMSVQGGVGSVLEFHGPGVRELSVSERATICNMATETGATSALFPSDERSLSFLQQFGRDEDYEQWSADKSAVYDRLIEIDLSALRPMVALPHSPDNVKPVEEAAGISVAQICIGSCTNSSFADLAIAARVVEGKNVHPDTALTISPGSRRTLAAITKSGDLGRLIGAGSRLLECSCGPCNGIGQAPASGTNTLRTHNRNFRGRCGTTDASSFLCSAETAAVSALTGTITDPREWGIPPDIESPEYIVDFPDLFLAPAAEPDSIAVVKGPNIKEIPRGTRPEKNFTASVGLKLGDDVTTDDILPGGATMLSLRSNVPASVPYLFQRVNQRFGEKLEQLGPQWIVVGGANYGQGSAREHAVMVPMYAGLAVVITKSFARIHRKNLINFGVVPLIFQDQGDYDLIEGGDVLQIERFPEQLRGGSVIVWNETKKRNFTALNRCDERETDIILNGGLLNKMRLKYETAEL
ncbi:MAG: aconitate hydratase [Deltaproteobacteria bacterium]|nr:aconitate hydratase [Deltaproteobacteria bacterium]